MLKWNRVEKADSYEVVIEGKTYKTNIPQFNIAFLDKTKDYDVQIFSVFGNCKSEAANFQIKSLPKYEVSFQYLNNGKMTIISTTITVNKPSSIFIGLTKNDMNTKRDIQNSITIDAFDFPLFYFKFEGSSEIIFTGSLAFKDLWFAGIDSNFEVITNTTGCRYELKVKDQRQVCNHIQIYFIDERKTFISIGMNPKIGPPSNSPNCDGYTTSKNGILFPYYTSNGILRGVGECKRFTL